MRLNIEYLGKTDEAGSILDGFRATVDTSNDSGVVLSVCQASWNCIKSRAVTRPGDASFFAVVSGVLDGSADIGDCLDAIAREVLDSDNRRTAASVLGGVPEDCVVSLLSAVHAAIKYVVKPIQGTMFEFVRSAAVRMTDMVLPFVCPSEDSGSDAIFRAATADLWAITERVRTVVATCQFAWVATRRVPVSLTLAAEGVSAVYVNIARPGEEFAHTTFAISSSWERESAYPALVLKTLDRAGSPDGDRVVTCQLPPPVYALPEERIITKVSEADAAETLARLCLWLWPMSGPEGACLPPEASCCKWDGSMRPYTRGLSYVLSREGLEIEVGPNPQSQRRYCYFGCSVGDDHINPMVSVTRRRNNV